MSTYLQDSGNSAVGQAEGLPKLTFVRPASRSLVQPKARIWPNPAEQLLLEAVVASIQAVQPLFHRSLITSYYRALTTAPLTLLSGTHASTAALLARLFAEAIVGQFSAHIAIVSGAAWHDATGESSYYRSLHERFSAIRCQTIVQEAATVANAGKAYFVGFDNLPLPQLLGHVKMLMAERPLAALAVSAVVPAEALADMMTHFPQAQIVRLRGEVTQTTEPLLLPPPIGLQRLWLDARAEAIAAAHRPTAEYPASNQRMAA